MNKVLNTGLMLATVCACIAVAIFVSMASDIGITVFLFILLLLVSGVYIYCDANPGIDYFKERDEDGMPKCLGGPRPLEDENFFNCVFADVCIQQAVCALCACHYANTQFRASEMKKLVEMKERMKKEIIGKNLK